MRTHVALLRGINVGGHNLIAMADLRQVMASLGLVDIATYIQSGNVVFTSAEADPAILADAVREALAQRLGLRPGVVVLTRGQWAQAVADNPFPEETNPKALHAIFRRAALSPGDLARVEAAAQHARDKASPDQVAVVGRTVYLRTPNGIGRSVLAERLARSGAKDPDASDTARNWATVTKLATLLDG